MARSSHALANGEGGQPDVVQVCLVKQARRIPGSRGRLARWGLAGGAGPLTRVSSRVRTLLMAHAAFAGANGGTSATFASERDGFPVRGYGAARSCSVRSTEKIHHALNPGGLRVPSPQTEARKTTAHSLMARILAFQPRGDAVGKPSGEPGKRWVCVNGKHVGPHKPGRCGFESQFCDYQIAVSPKRQGPRLLTGPSKLTGTLSLV